MEKMDRKVMLLTGGTRGIGRRIAEEAIRRGWFVSIGARNPADSNPDFAPEDAELVSYDAALGGEGDWVSGALARHGRVDAVVACAGIYVPDSIVTPDDARVLHLFDVNVHAPRRLAAAAWEALKVSGRGRVVVLGSLSGKRVKTADSALYSLSKFAAVGLAHALRHEGWDDGIRATAICPGLVATDMGLFAAGNGYPPDAMTQPEDLAKLTLDAMEMPNTLSQAEVTVNCQVDGLF